MAKIGLSKLVFSKYSASGNTVTYSDPVNNEKMAEYSTEFNQRDSNDLYLDNAVSETDAGTFSGGTINITTGDLITETSKLILGAVENTISYGDETDVKEIVFDDRIAPAELGVGLIEKHKNNGVYFYRAIHLARVKFNIPSDSATTQGASIEWKTQEISGQILRSDHVDENYQHPWKFTADFETEEKALAYLMYKGGKQEVKTG